MPARNSKFAETTPRSNFLVALPRLFVLLDNLPEDDQRNVQKTVATLVRGMEFDLTTFPAPESGRIGALDTFWTISTNIPISWPAASASSGPTL